MKKKVLLAGFLFFLFCASAEEALADGIIVPILPEPVILGDLYSVKYHRVKVEINDQIATTMVDQLFVNETNRTIEVQYIFPLASSAQVNKFSLFVGEQEIAGKLLSKEEARRIYEEIVRSQKDPALLEYVGQGMFRTSVFPIPPKGERRVKLVYSELLKKDGNRVEYLYPLNTEKFSKKVLEEVKIDYYLSSSYSLKNVYSPTHDISRAWNGNNKVSGRWTAEGIRPDHDFRLFWTLSDDDVGATLFSYRPNSGEDGYFLLLASPRVDTREVISKNIILVLDVSGSMQGEKIVQARSAARFIADNLNPQDNFNIIFYNDTVEPLWATLKPYTPENKREAVRKIGVAEADGSTDINSALTKALSQIKDSSRPNYVIFLTDGLPTAGVTDLNAIAQNVKKANLHNTRVFVFGVGYDVNAVLLDRLGTENHGFAEYVRPGENIEGKVSSFFSKIQNPAMTDISINYGDVIVKDVYPRELPDLFRGGQLVVLGRYSNTGERTITLTGKVGDKKQTFTYKVNFAGTTNREDFEFVARLWAQKKIGWLIDQIRLHGENKELIDEIVKLSIRYGIMTEYTSFLANEDVSFADAANNVLQARENIRKRAGVQTGVGGVNQSVQSGTMQRAAQAPTKAVFLNEEGEEVQLDTVKIIGSKTFYLKKGVWVDSEYKEGMKLVEVKQFSDSYFELARRRSDQARYLSFAPKTPIIVVIDSEAYKIIP